MVRCAMKGNYYITDNEDPVKLLTQEEAMGCAHHAYILLYKKQTADQDGLLPWDALHQLRSASRQVKY